MTYISQQDSYFFDYQMFKNIKGNEEKSEIDFIKKVIEIYEKLEAEHNRIKNFTDAQLMTCIVSENYRGYNDLKKPPSKEIIIEDYRRYSCRILLKRKECLNIHFYR